MSGLGKRNSDALPPHLSAVHVLGSGGLVTAVRLKKRNVAIYPIQQHESAIATLPSSEVGNFSPRGYAVSGSCVQTEAC